MEVDGRRREEREELVPGQSHPGSRWMADHAEREAVEGESLARNPRGREGQVTRRLGVCADGEVFDLTEGQVRVEMGEGEGGVLSRQNRSVVDQRGHRQIMWTRLGSLVRRRASRLEDRW